MHQLHCHWHSHCQFRNSICAIVFIEIENLNQNCSCIFGMLRPHSYVETRGRDSSSSCNKIESMEHRDMHTKAAHTAIHIALNTWPQASRVRELSHSLVRRAPQLDRAIFFFQLEASGCICLFLSAQQGGTARQRWAPPCKWARLSPAAAFFWASVSPLSSSARVPASRACFFLLVLRGSLGLVERAYLLPVSKQVLLPERDEVVLARDGEHVARDRPAHPPEGAAEDDLLLAPPAELVRSIAK